ncbi:uncharacterized protein LOC119579908 [Penaeus monodon]|uniref:uncharacterized protein LOC119579908 n=1 Tax=Penaeus monodon TaxID=6687 RepID=UPI0018A79055|nr:uncharacterized protein LOC119579908 [Penaeus monodon]
MLFPLQKAHEVLKKAVKKEKESGPVKKRPRAKTSKGLRSKTKIPPEERAQAPPFPGQKSGNPFPQGNPWGNYFSTGRIESNGASGFSFPGIHLQTTLQGQEGENVRVPRGPQPGSPEGPNGDSSSPPPHPQGAPAARQMPLKGLRC